MVHSLEQSAISPHGTWMSYLARYISPLLFSSRPRSYLLSLRPHLLTNPSLITNIPQMAALPINSINLPPHSLAFHPLALNDSNHPHVWKAYSVIYEQPPSVSQRALFNHLPIPLTSLWIGYHVDSFLPLSPNKTSM